MPPLFQRLRPHLPFLLGLFVLASVYFAPAYQGKVMSLGDAQAGYQAATEARQYKAQTGHSDGPHSALWTNSLFSGMPTYMISLDYPNTFVGTAVYKVLSWIPNPVNLLFVELLSMYILLVVLGCSTWLSALGAVGYALGSYNLIYLEAGHVSQIYALGFAPGMLAGLVMALRGRYWAGGAMFALFFCLQLAANHLQITYYTFFALGIYGLFETINQVRAGQTRQLLLGVAALVIAGVIGAGSYAGRLLVTNQYAKETIRGRGELTTKTTAAGQPDGAKKAAPKDGLDETYAFEYSYGLGETFSLLIPNFYGGTSNGGLDTKSALYKAMTAKGVDGAAAQQFAEQAAPLYRGDMPIVGGPAYAGAVLLFLFVLGMIVSRNPLRWPTLAVTLLLLMFAWGKNFMLLNGLMFDYFPYFNKFRAMTMTLLMVQLFIALGAVLGLQAIADRKLTWATLKQPFLISLGATAGIAAVFALLGGSLFSWQTANDTPFMAQYFGEGAAATDMVRALVSDRISVMRSDAIRSVIFILLAAGAIWAFVSGKLKAAVFYPVVLLLVLSDLFMVDKRFVNNADFVPKSTAQADLVPTPADEQILQDKSLSYRVFDQAARGGFMSDNRASAFHKSVGGYHAAKLRRYNELMTYALPKNTLHVLSMLNTKYVISAGQPDAQGQPTAPVAQLNDQALGNAWFVSTVRQVPDADAEIAAVQTLNPRDTAIVDQRFAAQLQGLPRLDTTRAAIRLTTYDPNKLTYESNAPTEQFAVFSEIYYRGDTDWNAYIDGKKMPHLRANYVLRAMRVPAGKHTIEFRFEPPVVGLGNTIDLIANLLLIAGLGVTVFLSVRSPRKS